MTKDELIEELAKSLDAMLRCACWFHEGPYGASPSVDEYRIAQGTYQQYTDYKMHGAGTVCVVCGNEPCFCDTALTLPTIHGQGAGTVCPHGCKDGWFISKNSLGRPVDQPCPIHFLGAKPDEGE